MLYTWLSLATGNYSEFYLIVCHINHFVFVVFVLTMRVGAVRLSPRFLDVITIVQVTGERKTALVAVIKDVMSM